MRSLVARVKPGGMIIMSEPVNLLPVLRRLRLRLGRPDGTADERPLEDADLQTIRDRSPVCRPGISAASAGSTGSFMISNTSSHGPPAGSFSRSISPTACCYQYPDVLRTASVAVMWANK